MKISKQDKELLKLASWGSYPTSKKSNTKYVQTTIDLKTIYLHRLIMERILGRKLLKNERIDHINQDGTDNRRENLRLCTHQQNMGNQPKRKNSTSKYKGVSFNKKNKKWHTRIWNKYQSIHLGYFLSQEEAAACYNFAANEIFGEFAYLNKL